MLELLNYTTPEVVTRDTDGKKMNVHRSALSRVLDEGHYRNVSLILNMMTKYKRHYTSQFCHLFQDLLDYESFKNYMNTMIIQTDAMFKK